MYTDSVASTITVGKSTLICIPDGLPYEYAQYVDHAELTDLFEVERRDGGTNCFTAVQDHRPWPFLVVAQHYRADPFFPRVMIVPETHLLLVGVEKRLLAYKLDPPKKLWEDDADTGFWAWAQHRQYIVMSAELELAAWDINGKKLWSIFVEPPWEYSVADETVYLDVMGQKSSFPLNTGPGK